MSSWHNSTSNSDSPSSLEARVVLQSHTTTDSRRQRITTAAEIQAGGDVECRANLTAHRPFCRWCEDMTSPDTQTWTTRAHALIAVYNMPYSNGLAEGPTHTDGCSGKSASHPCNSAMQSSPSMTRRGCTSQGHQGTVLKCVQDTTMLGGCCSLPIASNMPHPVSSPHIN